MADVKNPDILLNNSVEIPNAFSNCANCGISYHQSTNPVESVLLVCLHSFCRTCINNGCLRSDKGDPSKLQFNTMHRPKCFACDIWIEAGDDCRTNLTVLAIIANN